MSYSVLWIDHDHAKIFDFSPAGEKVSHYQNTHHHNHHTNHWEQEKKEQQKKFYSEVGAKLSSSSKFLIVGPDSAKIEFNKYLQSHDSHNLKSNVIGTETLDQMSEGEIRNFAKKYFHRYNLFNP